MPPRTTSPPSERANRAPRRLPKSSGSASEYAWGVLVIAGCTGACEVMFPVFGLADLAMVYLLGVVVASTRLSLYPSVFTAILSGLSFEFLFLPPRLSLRIIDPKHLVTFGVMLFVAVVASGLTERARRQSEAAHRAQVEAEAERLRSTLLSSVSHDL